MKKQKDKYKQYLGRMKNSKLTDWGEKDGVIQTEVQKDKLR